jgi:ankyrin repeat protein
MNIIRLWVFFSLIAQHIFSLLAQTTFAEANLEIGTDGFNNQNDLGNPEPLIISAARSGSMISLQREIASGADLNYQNKDGWTAMMFAVDNNQMFALNLV